MTRKRPKQIARYATFPARWRQHVERGEPFVAAGAGKGVATKRLSIERVAELGASTDVVVKNQLTGEVGQATLGELVRCLDQEGAVWYMAQHSVPACLERFVPKRPITGVAGLRKPNAWLGSANAFTQLHQDVLHNLVVQLDGKKQFTLFAPEDERYLYREDARPNYSQIALTTAVDRKRFPDYRKATPYRIELAAGDLLVMPAYWWHEVRTLEASLMLNYWWAPTAASVRGIDVEAQIRTGLVARRHVMKHLDLSGLRTDHEVVDVLCRQQLGLLAAIILADLADEVVESLAAKHDLDRRLYPASCEALLRTKQVLAPAAIRLLNQIRDDAATAETALATRTPVPAFATARSNRRLRELAAASRVPACRRLVCNNAAWMTSIAADSYLY